MKFIRWILSFILILFLVSNASTTNLYNDIFVENLSMLAFEVYLGEMKEPKELTYKAGKFNETRELYETITEILKKHDIYSEEFLFLLLGIAAVETYNGDDLSNPVAKGLFQIEPKTANYIISKIKKKDEWLEVFNKVYWKNSILVKQLRDNLELQVVLMYYGLQVKGVNIEKLKLDMDYLARIWKKYWNTYLGKGTVGQFKRKWKVVGLEDLRKEIING